MGSTPDFLFLCDSSEQVGLGHFHRCLAIAKQLKDWGRESLFWMSEIHESSRRKLEAAEISWSHQVSLCADSKSTDFSIPSVKVIVVDSYKFDSRVMGKSPEHVVWVAIDDNGALRDASFDVLVNPNLHAEAVDYSQMRSTALFLGPEYALIRSEIIELHSKRRSLSNEGVLVAIGGTDSLGLTRFVLEAMAEIEELVVLRSPNIAPAVLASAPRLGVRSFTTFEEAMLRASFAVIGAGSMMWECIFLGIPFIALIVADNQEAAGREVMKNGLGQCVDARRGFPSELFRRTLFELYEACTDRDWPRPRRKSLIDGRGVERVAAELLRRSDNA